MRINWIPFSLIFLTLTLQAENQRREPSLFLEYERELKKVNDSLRHDENPFDRHIPSISKPTPPIVPNVTPVAVIEPAPVVLKTDIPPIGHDLNPFLVINKPVATKIPISKTNDEPAPTVTKRIVKNLKTAKEKVLARAKDFLGTPYGFGNKDGERTDCSGFTQQVYRQFGVSLPRSAAEQAQLGEDVDLNDLQVGDLLFYRTYKADPSHVAIYAGDGQIIHASYANKKVQFDSIDKGYYKQRFLYAKRLALNSTDYDE